MDERFQVIRHESDKPCKYAVHFTLRLMRTLLIASLLSVAQSTIGAEPLPTEIAPLSLGQEIPSGLAVVERREPFRGWSFDNEIDSETAKMMWQRFLPEVSLESIRANFSLSQKQVAEVQFLIHSDRPRELSRVIERELSKRHGKPATSRLKAVKESCPSELVRKWTDDRGTLVLVTGEDYGAIYASLRSNALAKNIASKKQTFFSQVLQGEPCLRW